MFTYFFPIQEKPVLPSQAFSVYAATPTTSNANLPGLMRGILSFPFYPPLLRPTEPLSSLSSRPTPKSHVQAVGFSQVTSPPAATSAFPTQVPPTPSIFMTLASYSTRAHFSCSLRKGSAHLPPPKSSPDTLLILAYAPAEIATQPAALSLLRFCRLAAPSPRPCCLPSSPHHSHQAPGPRPVAAARQASPGFIITIIAVRTERKDSSSSSCPQRLSATASPGKRRLLLLCEKGN